MCPLVVIKRSYIAISMDDKDEIIHFSITQPAEWLNYVIEWFHSKKIPVRLWRNMQADVQTRVPVSNFNIAD